MALLSRLFQLWAVLLVLGYAVAGFTGYRLGGDERDRIPTSVRSSPGGYRSFHFWHSGYSGGK